MHTAESVRRHVESLLEHRIPAALTPAPRLLRPVAATGVEPLDALLGGGLPVGGITEVVGPMCSGQTFVATSFVARMTAQQRVCAWVDVLNEFDPASAASCGVDLQQLLWIRCGAQQGSEAQPAVRRTSAEARERMTTLQAKEMRGGASWSHPRDEVRGLSAAIHTLMRPERLQPSVLATGPREPSGQPHATPRSAAPLQVVGRRRRAWQYDVIEQALWSTDLLVQTGGFAAIVLDFGNLAPEFVTRIELATWHRYRAAAERMQSCILLLTRYPCAKSSSELQLRLHAGNNVQDGGTVFAGLERRVEVVRHRFREERCGPGRERKPPVSAREVWWQDRTTWVGPR